MSTDPKTAVMDQVRQQSALSNARALVEVRSFSLPRSLLLPYSPPPLQSLALSALAPFVFLGRHPTKSSFPAETQRALFRALRAEAGHRAVGRRTDVLHRVHGEVHGGVEHGQPAVHLACAEGRRGWRAGGWGAGALKRGWGGWNSSGERERFMEDLRRWRDGF
nr:hypothetical protein CFP56_24494 [Quercus suber]